MPDEVFRMDQHGCAPPGGDETVTKKGIAMNSTKDLRTFLVEKMTAVANNELELDKAKGISNLAQQIYNTLNIEIKMAITKSKIGDQEIKEVDFNV